MNVKMIDTSGGCNAIVLETRKKIDSNALYIEDENQEVPVLFLEDKKGDLCSFKSLRKVHEVNQHKGKDQVIAAYRNTGWMTPDLANIIDRVVSK